MIEKTIQERIKDYYRGERISNAFLFLFGATGLSWTFLLYIWRHGHLSTGLFFSAFPLAIFCMVTGGYRFWRSLKRYRILEEKERGKIYLISEELPHLLDRKKRFIRKRKVNSTGMFIGFILLFCSVFLHWNHLFLGTAISITLFSSLLLAFDLFGQFRTEEFLYHIEKFQNKSEVM